MTKAILWRQVICARSWGKDRLILLKFNKINDVRDPAETVLLISIDCSRFEGAIYQQNAAILPDYNRIDDISRP